jgi:hypothetical protein
VDDVVDSPSSGVHEALSSPATDEAARTAGVTDGDVGSVWGEQLENLTSEVAEAIKAQHNHDQNYLFLVIRNSAPLFINMGHKNYLAWVASYIEGWTWTYSDYMRAQQVYFSFPTIDRSCVSWDEFQEYMNLSAKAARVGSERGLVTVGAIARHLYDTARLARTQRNHQQYAKGSGVGERHNLLGSIMSILNRSSVCVLMLRSLFLLPRILKPWTTPSPCVNAVAVLAREATPFSAHSSLRHAEAAPV